MPPRYSYWTILAGGLPTAFRAAERAELLPTFNRIREKHPDAEMKWFARGRLWQSPEEAQADLQRVRSRRDRDWRPGGDHRDPRQAFKTKRTRDTERREKPPQWSSSKHDVAHTRPARPPSKPGAPYARTSRPPAKPSAPYERTSRPPAKPGPPHEGPSRPSSKPGAPHARLSRPPAKPGAPHTRDARPPKRRPR